MPEEKDMQHRPSMRERFRRFRASMTPGRRRLAVRLWIAVAAGVLLLAIPTAIATQPKFLQRYSHYGPQYTTWSTSVHAQVACQRCHVRPGFVGQAVYDVRMLGEFYLSTVMPARQPALLTKPANSACLSCHYDMRTVSPSGDLNIPHRAHVNVLKMDCVTCHTYLVHETSPEGKHVPRMATCLTCHDGKKAKNACSTCHTNKRIPESHRQANWLAIHPQMQAKLNCKQCHQWTANWCADCHARRPKSHTVDWRAKHGAAVKVRRSCEACHAGPFCIRCHGVVPKLNANPSLTLVK